MATRNDVNADYQPSPRVVEVAAPSTELTVQDLVDTLRVSEEAFVEGLAFDKLIDAAGKEDLGGGVLVGITANLQDAQVSFEARRTPAETGNWPRYRASRSWTWPRARSHTKARARSRNG